MALASKAITDSGESMNLCGGVVEEAPLCGPCTKEGPDTSLLSDDDSVVETPRNSVVQRRALDSIQTAIEPVPLGDGLASYGSRELAAGSVSTTSSKPAIRRPIVPASDAIGVRTPSRSIDVSVASSLMINCSPSPILLNPLSNEDWDTKHRTRKERLKPNLVHPRPESSLTMDKLMLRLEEGFRLELIGQKVAVSQVFLFLHEERDRLCIRHRGDEADEKKEDSLNWREIPINKIMRLEARKRDPTNPASPGRGFSVIANEEANIKYYDFTAPTALDREVLLSTLVVVLEQLHNPSETRPRVLPVIPALPEGGTMEQPILCSPSLEDSSLPFPEGLNSKASDVSSRKILIQPRPNGRPIIDLEGVDDSSRKLEIPFGMSMSSLHSSRAALASDIPTSPIQKNSSWCDDDICTLAIRDMAYTCSGILDQNLSSGASAAGKSVSCTPLSSEQVAMIEEYIATVLGAPNAVYSYLATSRGDVWDASHTEAVSVTERAVGADTGKRNRASKLNAQANRLKNLRNEMTFAVALKQSQELQTTQSCDDLDRRGYSSQKATKDIIDQFHASALLQTVVGTMESGAVEVSDDGSEDFYDSDPEDSRPVATTRNPRQIIFNSSKTLPKPRRHRALSGTGIERQGPGKRISKSIDEEAVVQLVQAMNNERLLLMWHPCQTRENPSCPPSCVKLWIESGVYLVDGTFLLPKLTWAKCKRRDGVQLKLSEENLYKLDLLDICRIRPTKRVDRSLHPFADGRKSFEVETQDGFFLFESETTEERNRIVYGLKLVVARLASLLMLRDFRAAEEFFGQVSAGVPGEAPTWATGLET